MTFKLIKSTWREQNNPSVITKTLEHLHDDDDDDVICHHISLLRPLLTSVVK